MGIISIIVKSLQRLFPKEQTTANEGPKTYTKERIVEEIHSIWDYIRFVEQSQAHHICSILGFDEWVDMEEILRRIKEIFGAEYKNERSLYPYVKTLVDTGLVETTAFGGKRKWRKKEVLIKIQKKAVEEQERNREVSA